MPAHAERPPDEETVSLQGEEEDEDTLEDEDVLVPDEDALADEGMSSDEGTAPALLVVVTGADRWTLADGTSHPTGFWAEEFIEPMRVFRDAGVDVTVATPGAVSPTVDEASLSPEMVGGEERAAELRSALEALEDVLADPVALEVVSPADYDGVFVPGGHGPMEDLAESPAMGELLTAMLDDDKVIAAVCHGPAALLSAVREDGSWAFAGNTLSSFTDEEETQAGLADRAEWLLESRLREAGGNLSTGSAWEPFSIIDGNIVTGQNPASSTSVAEKTVKRLRARAHFIHVVPHQGAWTFKHEHGEPQGTFPSQKAAERAAMEHARAHGDWEVIIHDRRGRIRDSEAVRPIG
jgi:putative intracellular protease/amidase